MRRQLAEEDCTALVEPGDGMGVLGRNMADGAAGMAGGRDAGGREDVLQREGDAVHRPAMAAGGDLRLRRAGLL